MVPTPLRVVWIKHGVAAFAPRRHAQLLRNGPNHRTAGGGAGATSPAGRLRLPAMTDAASSADGTLPLAGLRVLEFCHTIMGPTAGLILADLGADVIKIEPAAGDPTRRRIGFAAGFFATFN